MNRSRRLSGKILLVLALVCLTLLGQALALASQEESHHSPDHCCLLCHAGPLPILQSTVTATIAPVFLTIWLAPTLDCEPAHQVLISNLSSRGPPSA
jgi:uncharacterized membrane protein